MYASWSLGLFLYQTFDAVDGSQARRTRQSGPLGELFDHGVDSLNTFMEVLIFSATMNLGQGWRTVLVLCASLGTFYVQTWEEYHTHTLTLGLVSGPVEGILTLCLVYGLTAYFGGGSVWSQSMLGTLGVAKPEWLPDFVYNAPFTDWYMFYGGIMLVVNTVQATQTVMAARRAEGKRARVAMLGLLPFVITWILVPTYLALQPTILYSHLVPFIFFVGLTNAYSVGRMICAHLTKSPFPRSNILWLPLLVGIVDSMGPLLQQHVSPRLGLDGWLGWPSALGGGVYQVAFMFLCLGLAIGVYGSFVVDVIVSICDYLDIWCLTIKHPYRPVPVEEHKKQK